VNQATRAVGADETPMVDPARPAWARAARFLPALAAVLSTIWVFRTVLFSGELPGDIGDSRWTIALHEHWYRVWTGQESIRDLHYYYPLPKTLGTSDAYLVQGALYSFARLLGVGLVDAWVFAAVGIFLIGGLGVAVLSRQLLDGLAAQTAFVVLCCTSYAVFAGYTHVQLFGMLAVSWLFVGLHDLVSRRHVRRGIALLVVVPPVLALSSWYPMVLGAIVLGFLTIALALVSSGAGIARTVRHVGADLWRTLRSVPGVLLAVLLVLLWGAVLWVYLPSRGVLPPAQWIEVQTYSPRWSDIWNAIIGGGGLWSWLYLRFPTLAQSNTEQQYGFTPVLFGAFTVAGLWLLRTSVLAPRRPVPGRRPEAGPASVGRTGLLAATLAVIAVLAFFLMDERGLSIYRSVWSRLPGLETIRSPYRVMTILYGMVLFVVVRSIELVWRQAPLLRARWRRAGFAVAVGALLLLSFAEMQRVPDTRWTRDQLLPAAMLAQVDQIRASCDAFVVLGDDPDGPGWLTPINAVMLSTISGVPTPQGYARADPVGYPDTGAADYDPISLVGWMREQGFDGRACAVTGNGTVPITG
jgi:hypothetical protein